jgi:hypothetical protein
MLRLIKGVRTQARSTMLRLIKGVPGRPGGRIELSPCLHGGNHEGEAKEGEAVHGA